MKKQTVFIVGAGGMVGATAAQALAIKEVVSEIVLIDVAEELVAGQAMDINHASAFARDVHVRVGVYDEIKDDDIVVVTCGLAQKPGQTRLELLDANVAIIRDVVTKITAGGRSIYIVMVANPVDVLTKVALDVSGLPKERVFGTGTMLDTARYRVTLANKLGLSQQEINGYVLGEHGDSSFPALSGTVVGGVPLTEFPGYSDKLVATIDKDIRDAAYRIIEAKKSTYYGIGSVIARIVEALTSNTASVLPVCSLANGEYGLDGVVIGLPSLVSHKGVQIIEGYPLSSDELDHLHESAKIVKEAISNTN
jgi:L-lactate dehydrogenase